MTMTMDEEIKELKDATDKLKMLLDGPEPGLATWRMAVGQQMKRISDLYRGN